MSLSDRGAPQDTAIQRENLEQTIDVRGPGRYYPEEYTGQIQAVRQRAEIIADVPKTLAGIVLNYNEHALDSWRSEQTAQLYDKHLANNLTTENRQRQLDLESDLDIYNSHKKLQSDIFNTRKRVAMEGLGGEEEAINTLLDSYKDLYADKPILAQKWQKIIESEGLTSLKEARKSDLETDLLLVDHAINNEFDLAYNSVCGLEKDPDGNPKPMVNIGTALQSFSKKIAGFVKDGRIPVNYVYEQFPKWYNKLVLGQAQAYVQQFNDGAISSDTLETNLLGLKNSYLEQTAWLIDENTGKPLKDSKGNELYIDLTLSPETQNELTKLYQDNKNGSGGGDGIAKNACDNFKQAIGWQNIQEKGYSKELLSFSSDDLNKVFASQALAVLHSTASDSSKAETLTDLYRTYRQASMMIKVRESAKAMKQNALPIMRGIIDDINDKLQNNRENTDWETYGQKGITIGNTTYVLGLGSAPLNDEMQKMVAANTNLQMVGVFPRLGQNKEDAAEYWRETLGVFQKFVDYLTNNNPGEMLKQTDSEYQADTDTLTNNINRITLLTPTKAGSDDYEFNRNNPNPNLKKVSLLIQNMVKKSNEYGWNRAVPDSTMNDFIKNIENTKDPREQLDLAKATAYAFIDAGAGYDLRSFAYSQNKKGESDGGLYSAAMLLKAPSLQKALEETINTGLYATLSKNDATLDAKILEVENKAVSIYKKLKIGTTDRNLLEPYKKLCAIAAYDIDKKKIDQNAYGRFLEEGLSGQFIDLNSNFAYKPDWMGRTLFKNEAIFRFHPAFKPYGNNIKRLQEIGEKAYNYRKRITMGDSYSNNVINTLKKIEISADDETGNFMFMIGGNKAMFNKAPVGTIYDDRSIFSTITPEEIVEVNFNSMLSYVLRSQGYEEYKKHKEYLKQRYGQADLNMYTPEQQAIIKRNRKILSESEFNTKTILGMKWGSSKAKMIEKLKKYHESKDKTGALYQIR